MPPQPPKGPNKRPAPAPQPPAPARPSPPQGQSAARRVAGGSAMPGVPQVISTSTASNEIGLGVAVSADAGAGGGTVTARKAGGLRDMSMEVDPDLVGLRPALQHMAKAVNIAFQSDYGENYLESVYQAAVVRNNEIHIIHREYFGFRENWFGQFGRLLRSMSLTCEGPDPGSPEGQKRILDKGPATIRGLFNLIGRKLDLVSEFEDRVPAYVEQMFDRLEASGIIVGWDRDDWDIWTTTIGLDVRISPKPKPEA